MATKLCCVRQLHWLLCPSYVLTGQQLKMLSRLAVPVFPMRTGFWCPTVPVYIGSTIQAGSSTVFGIMDLVQIQTVTSPLQWEHLVESDLEWRVEWRLRGSVKSRICHLRCSISIPSTSHDGVIFSKFVWTYPLNFQYPNSLCKLYVIFADI